MTTVTRVGVTKPPRHLRSQVTLGRVVPFIGAGISMGVQFKDGSRLPGYESLLRQVLGLAKEDGLVDADSEQECERLLGSRDLMHAADRLEYFIGAKNIYRIVREVLNRVRPKPSQVHEFLNLIGFPMLLTSNYDRLLETTIEPPPEVFTQHDSVSMQVFLADRAPFILKVHGDLTRPETIVLGWKRYQKLHEADETSKEGTLREFFRNLLQNYTLLFLGCSFSGGEYTSYFEELANGFGITTGPHYALLEAGTMSAAKKRLWRTRLGIEIIEFVPDDAYSQVWEFLTLLPTQKKEAPPRRSGSSWKQFYLPEQRPQYLRHQLILERRASSVRFLTPSITNALAHEAYLRRYCDQGLDKFKAAVKSFSSFKARTLEFMLKRAMNIAQRAAKDDLEVRVIFSLSRLEEELKGGDPEVVQRMRTLATLLRDCACLRIRAAPGAQDSSSLMRNSYALIFSSDPTPDIACAYAAQATTNDFHAHVIQINTPLVTQRVEEFEKAWASCRSEAWTVKMIRRTVE